MKMWTVGKMGKVHGWAQNFAFHRKLWWTHIHQQTILQAFNCKDTPLLCLFFHKSDYCKVTEVFLFAQFKLLHVCMYVCM